MTNTIERSLSRVSPDVRTILEACLSGQELSWQGGVRLSAATGGDLHALCLTADTLRREQVGDAVTYVVNRNINFTNVCVKNCKFCAFSRDLRSEEAYLLDTDEVIRRARQAQEFGATEVCIQAGLLPTADGSLYLELCRAVHEALPDLHIHAFSPSEVTYGALRSRRSVRDYLTALKDAGLGSLPGTSAEILDDAIRTRISPGRLSTARWIEVIRTAHEVGLPTSATMMFGHVENATDRMRHMDLLRTIQRETGGFTEFVPLSFVHAESPLFSEQVGADCKAGPSGNDVIRLYAIARLMLGATFRNLQASWVKEGLRMSQWLLGCGVNDLGGTLMNESISTTAGAQHGQLASPSQLRSLIRDAGRTPVERSTTYDVLRTFARSGEEDAPGPLDAVDDSTAAFGSYSELAADESIRYAYAKPKLVTGG